MQGKAQRGEFSKSIGQFVLCIRYVGSNPVNSLAVREGGDLEIGEEN